MTPKKKATEDVHAVEGDEAPSGPTIINESPASEPERLDPPVVTVPKHSLDDAPVNSKIVKTLDGAWLATPTGVVQLKKTDMASRLPDGARIQKIAENRYRATQLSPAEQKPDFDTLTAYEAIQRFVPHFHGGDAIR